MPFFTILMAGKKISSEKDPSEQQRQDEGYPAGGSAVWKAQDQLEAGIPALRACVTHSSELI